MSVELQPSRSLWFVVSLEQKNLEILAHSNTLVIRPTKPEK